MGDVHDEKPQKKTPPYKDGVSIKFQQSPVLAENGVLSWIRLS